MTQADKVEHGIDEEKLEMRSKVKMVNVNNIDVVACEEFEDKDVNISKNCVNISGPSTAFSSYKESSNVCDDQPACVSSAGECTVSAYSHKLQGNVVTDAGIERKDSMVDRVKRLLRVDSDETEELHNKYRETSKDREEKIKLFEEQLNIKVK